MSSPLPSPSSLLSSSPISTISTSPNQSNNNNNNGHSITPSQPIRPNPNFLTPPSPTTTTSNIVNKLKNHVPKRLSLTTSSRSKSSSSSSHSISPIQTRQNSLNSTLNQPLPAILKIRIDAGRDLLAKDRNGKSDPFLKLSLINQSTSSTSAPIILQEKSKLLSDIRFNTLEPVWYQSDLSIDFGSAFLELIIFPKQILTNLIKIVVFDKDRLKNDYLGELEISLLDWIYPNGITSTPISSSTLSFDSSINQARWISLTSSKSRTKVTGQLLVKIGFLSPAGFQASLASLPSTLLASLPISPASPAHKFEPLNLENHPSQEVVKDNDQIMKEIASLLHATITSHDSPSRSASQPRQSPASSSALVSGSVENETDEQDKQKRVSRILNSNKKLRSIVFKKIRRKSTEPTSANSGGGEVEEVEVNEEGLVRGQAVLSAHPTHGVGTRAKGRIVSGQELSEAIGEESPESDDLEDSLSSIISTDDESEENEIQEIRNLSLEDKNGNGDQKAQVDSELGPAFQPISTQPSSMSSTLVVPPTMSRSSSSSSKKLLSIPSALSKKLPSGIKALAPKSNTSATDSTNIKSVRLTEPTSPIITKTKNRKFHQRLRKQKSEHSFKDGHLTKDDVMGICFIELDRASGLPYWKAVTRIGFDMDPFVIISFGEKIFRTKVIRHSLEPVWDERLFFHVKREELSYTILFSLFDWDKMSSNDYIGEAKLKMSSLIEENERMMSVDPVTGLYKVDANGKLIGDQMVNFEFHINTPTSSPSNPKTTLPDPNNPSPPSSTTVSSTNTTTSTLFIKAKYVPYSALRQVFWRKYLESFDTDESGTISKIELVSMLDSLGSTLSSETIESFFVRYGKSSEVGGEVLSVDQVICCLEDELVKGPDEKRKVKKRRNEQQEGGLEMKSDEEEEEDRYMPCESDVPLGFVGHNPVDTVIEKEDINEVMINNERKGIEDIEVIEGEEEVGLKSLESEEEEEKAEKVINISRCPICHKERINSRMEIDIVTHLAVCASTDWSSLRHILSPGNFVTSNQANRKWFTKVIGKVQNGKYSLGADSANIIVKDRMSGELVEEKMQVVVRVGIRLMYRSSGSKSRMEKENVKKMLRSLTLKQGMKFNSTESKKEIEGFVNFHGLDLNEVLKPIESFQTFNEFFYRELKPNARKIEGIGNPNVMVSCADCRMMVFENLGIGKSIWIKGKSFCLKKVLGDRIGLSNEDVGENEEEKWTIGIFRLAPQDYHRFHSPLDGTVEQIERIDGQYYTVNPMAIRSTIDVYGENVRVVIGMRSEGFGKVYCVLVGAMMVGSIEVGVKVGDQLKKGDHLGYFAFGGSTILVIGESELIEWDEDLLMNSRGPIETLVRVGNQVGVRKKKK